jgi:hypothetical protein
MQPSDNIGFISAPYALTSLGASPNTQMYACGSGVKTITGSTTFVLTAYISSIPSGQFFSRNNANGSSSFVSFTRIG